MCVCVGVHKKQDMEKTKKQSKQNLKRIKEMGHRYVSVRMCFENEGEKVTNAWTLDRPDRNRRHTKRKEASRA